MESPEQAERPAMLPMFMFMFMEAVEELMSRDTATVGAMGERFGCASGRRHDAARPRPSARPAFRKAVTRRSPAEERAAATTNSHRKALGPAPPHPASPRRKVHGRLLHSANGWPMDEADEASYGLKFESCA